MGCNPSKQSACPNCHAQCSPVRRSYSSTFFVTPRRSTYLISPPSEDNGNHHVALTSTTLGYLLQESSTIPDQVLYDPALTPPVRRNVPERNCKDIAVDEKMTKIAPRTPSGEPEIINAWELMEGLDDSSPFRPSSNSNATSKSSDFVPNTNDLKPLISEKDRSPDHIPDDATKQFVSRTKERLVLYFTSLRGIRKTYEDCCHVRAILKNSGVHVDERDVSMHSGFKEELKELLGDRYGGLPKVFVGKKYIGGADEIKRFHDEFLLDKVLEGCEMVDDCGGGGGGSDGGGCEVCGDIRFLPCDTCSGSCKIYCEANSNDGENEEAEESDYGFQRCPDCNENGLVRCPICCD